MMQLSKGQKIPLNENFLTIKFQRPDMTESNIDLLTGIIGNVNCIPIPIALTFSLAFGHQSPFTKVGKSQRVVIDSSGDGHRKMFRTAVLIQSAGIEAENGIL